ncbi:coiled-coil domain-containing protein 162-like [Cynoglossus semilaevis]|uniref:coiled-coil domain-containing protein 162-like n=1 Tax=Cynoglossus semilaevis TaxID=244447 RepID=UPI0004975278|nr:coiled-coil domain-containing protein 162-like [Cynoglossus semilaevis]
MTKKLMFFLQVKISEDHLRRCVAHLGALVMERERRSFLLYSQFYEQILQQNQKLLYQREQDLKATDVKKQKRNRLQEVSGSCRHMMLEISALQARVAHLEDEKHSLEEKLCLKFKEHYDHVVRQLVSTCVQLKAKLDEHPLQMEQDVSVLVNTVRGEGVERLVQIKNKYDCTKDNWDLTVTQLKKVELHDLSLENSQLTSLLCKLKALSRWKQTVDQEKLHRQLLQTQQREISSRSDALRVKMVAEEEVLLLQEELDAVRQMLSSCQAECSRTKKLLSKKSEELQMARHQSAKEARSRQELDTYRAKSLEQMRVDVEDRDRQLRALSEQLDRGSKMSQFQRQRSAKKIRQVKGQLHQERSLKQEAFQQVEKLQNQVVDMEETFSRNSSAAVQSRSGYRLSASRWSCSRSPSASLQRLSQQLRSLTSDSTTLLDPASERRHLRAATDQSRSNTRIDRQRAEPSQLHVLTPQRLLPEL